MDPLGTEKQQHYNAAYRQSFSRYIHRTDGKTILARNIGEIASERSLSHLLDIGAGDGFLSAKLKDSFNKVTVVECKSGFQDTLSSIGFDGVFNDRIENINLHTLPPTIDTVLMSYAINGISIDGLRNVFQHFSGPQIARRPTILLCTESEDSPWSRFAHDVCAYLEIPRRGGSQLDLLKARDAGAKPELLKRARTRIFDYSLDELYTTLSFFFLRDAGTAYESGKKDIMPILARHAVNEEGQCVLPVYEEIYELTLP